MFIINSTKSYIGYKDLINNCVLVFDTNGNLVTEDIKCTNWESINLFEVPVEVLNCVANYNNCDD